MLHSLQRKWRAGDALTRVCPAKYKGGSFKGFTPVQTSANMMKVPEFPLFANLSHYYELELHFVGPHPVKSFHFPFSKQSQNFVVIQDHFAKLVLTIERF